MSSDVIQKKGERTFALTALLWSLGTLSLASLVFVDSGSTEPSSHNLWVLIISAALFALALVAGVRTRFVLGRQGVSTRLRHLSGSLSVGCFLVGWCGLAYAYTLGGDSAVYSTVRHVMPTTMGLSVGVLGAAALSLFLWECVAGIAEIRQTESKRNLVLATVLSLTMALICVAALSSVVVGRMFFVGES